MKKLIPLILIICCSFICLTACSKDEIVDQYNHVLQTVGDNGLTNDNDLQGKRNLGEDSYVGTYTANYDNFSGKEIVFGGTALERENGNKLTVSCNADTTSGTLKLILQTGTDEPKILSDMQSAYSDTIELPSASNYIILEMENFTGSIDLTIE
ncbi:TPA: hypothetical protein MIW38_003761 [Clostridioides difficile]|nr:hypothetical protein [Clostridioides difficile]HBY2905838.1 hypothetical protein [Clostridioides difficile]HBY2993678.1 hypothetical protein [Clostridioides difficile]HBY2996943.1 hypothetical protein [Clostridioides difficile]